MRGFIVAGGLCHHASRCASLISGLALTAMRTLRMAGGLGVRHYRPANPDPGKLPVILCHGLGLNATFWTITDDHLPGQLTARGYDVFVFDIRGSGENARVGRDDRFNKFMRQTFLESAASGTGRSTTWSTTTFRPFSITSQRETGHDRVNWIGHSLGGMLVFTYLELAPHPERIANFVGMGSTIIQAEIPRVTCSRPTAGLRALSLVASPGRLGRPLAFVRVPGMELIDRFYYTNENVDRETISRFYGYTLEDTGPGALRQLDPYLEYGHMLSADRTIDYSARLGEITNPDAADCG